jgi:O-antigen ligase
MMELEHRGLAVAVLGSAVAVLAGGALAFTVDARLGAVALAVPVALLIVESPAAGTVLLALTLPLEELSALMPGGLTLQKLIGVAVFGAWLVRALLRRDPVRVPPGAVPLAALVAWGAASTFWAAEPSAALMTAATQVQLLAFYLLLVNVLDSPARLRRALDAHLLGGVALSVLALYLLSTGVLQAGRVAVVVDHQLLVQSNLLATVLLLPVGIALIGAFDGSRSPLERLTLMGAAGLCLTTIMLTMSRGALVALGAMTGVLSLAGGPWLFAVGALLVIPGVWLAGPELGQRLGEGATLLDRAAGRLDIWQVAWVMIRRSPLIGLGLGCFSLIYFDYLSQATGVSWKHAAEVVASPQRASHNAYLGTTAELGIVGLGLLVAALVSHLYGGFRAWRLLAAHRHPAAPLVLVSLAGVVAVVVMGFTSDITIRKYLWFTLALSAVAQVPRGAPVAVRPAEPVQRAA